MTAASLLPGTRPNAPTETDAALMSAGVTPFDWVPQSSLVSKTVWPAMTVSVGSSIVPPTPYEASVGPIARTRIFFGLLPETTKPQISALSPDPTRPRVEMLTTRGPSPVARDPASYT